MLKSWFTLAPVVLAALSLPAEGRPERAIAPDLELKRLDGKGALRVSDFRGRVLVLDFWATWCEPCKRSLPKHVELAERYGSELALIALSVDEKLTTAKSYVERHQLPLSFAHDSSGGVARAFKVESMPYALVIDREGRIAERVVGEPYPALLAAVGRVIAEPRAEPPKQTGTATRASTAPQPGAAPGCAGAVERQATLMGTLVQVRVCPRSLHDRPADLDEAVDRVFSEFGRLEALWSTWVPTSEISRLNQAAGGAPLTVSEDTFDVLSRAVEGSRRSGGVFDVTFGPLGELWQFDTPPGAHEPTRLARIPEEGEIQKRRALVGSRELLLDRERRTAQLARSGMRVHLGGIGKGAAVDRAVRLLSVGGFRDFFVKAGGDLYCAGANGPRPWRVGVAHPRRADALLGSLTIRDAAFSTSGDYERFAIIDGRRYHHIIDLRTGYPAKASQSATVLAQTAVEAEVLTKTAFILGGVDGLRAVESAGAKALIIDAEGKSWTSPGLSLEPVTP